MSTISFDGQSFSVDGRRIWLVSGTIPYARTPHPLWRRRIRAAREAGLNCIDTQVFWNAHEHRPGQFNFDGDLDLRRFVQTVGEEGLYCILRPGPYVGAGWDFGGLPPWLHRISSGIKGEELLRLRQSDPAFLEACSRYLTAVMEQVHDLQITVAPEAPAARPDTGNRPGQAAGGYTGGGRGPILMMQAEHHWRCYNPDQAENYLREIVRYLRENGCEVPITNDNNLWQPVEGALNTWSGGGQMMMDMRQLAVVQPEAPRLVADYRIGSTDRWGEAHHPDDPETHLYHLAGILASGSQYNLSLFHGGTNFAFRGGRAGDAADGFITTSHAGDAPLFEAGGRGLKYALVKRLSTFASQFDHLFAHLEPSWSHAAAAPAGADHPLSVVHCRGSQGSIVFVLRSRKDPTRRTQVMLPNGLSLPVELGGDRAAWFVFDANLDGVAVLDHTNLRPWAFVEKKMLVLFGPADTDGLLSIDGTPLHVRVPQRAGRAQPLVERHEQITVVVLSREQVDRAYLFSDGLAINAAGLDDQGRPIPPSGGAAPLMSVDLEGRITVHDDKPPRHPPAPRPRRWEYASLQSILDASDETFEKIDGPEGLARLECDTGYGWYKTSIGKTKSGLMLAAQGADRLHIYNDSELKGLLGRGPGAEPGPVKLKLNQEVVVLADNLGRYDGGQSMGESKGLFGHLLNVRRVRLDPPKVVHERAADPFALRGLIVHGRKSAAASMPRTEALVWNVRPAARRPMILEITGEHLRGTLVVNEEPYAVYLGRDSGQAARFMLTPGERGVSRGHNEIKLSLLSPLAPGVKVLDHVTLYQVTSNVTSRGAWGFKRWTLPEPQMFEKLPSEKHKLPSQPTWFRCRFTVSGREGERPPLWFEPRSMSKGQLYLNGRNVGRYFVATAAGKAVPPQRLYYLPEPWLEADQPNELLIFDEHGKSPRRSRLVYDPMGPFAR